MSTNFNLITQTALELNLTVDIVKYSREFCIISNNTQNIIVAETFCLLKNKKSEGPKITRDKFMTNYLFICNNIPSPKTIYINKYSEISNLKHTLKMPLIVKENRGSKSQNIHTDIKTSSQLKTLILSEKMNDILIQEMVQGNEYRILVYKNKIIGCLHFIKPFVIGNGQMTIKQLITLRNKQLSKMHRKIQINNKVASTLAQLNLDLNSIPKHKEIVYLQNNSCLSEGGKSINCTNAISKTISDLALRIANTVNLNLAGIDIICDNISKELTEQDLYVLEVNSRPSLSIHNKPDEGHSINVAKIILKDLFNINS
jgi:cyanophycin synthetase